MRILYDSDLATKLANSNLFFDTNTFIGALFFNETFGKLLGELRRKHCAFLTIPSVLFEFTRGSDTVEAFNTRLKFIEGLTDTIYPIERSLAGFEDLTITLQKIKEKMDYTDFLLCACLYKFSNSFLITENHTHFPTTVFDRSFLITIDTDKELRNYAIYKFSKEKFNKAAENILRGKPAEEEIPF